MTEEKKPGLVIKLEMCRPCAKFYGAGTDAARLMQKWESIINKDTNPIASNRPEESSE